MHLKVVDSERQTTKETDDNQKQEKRAGKGKELKLNIGEKNSTVSQMTSYNMIKMSKVKGEAKN